VPADTLQPTHVPIEFVELLTLSPFGGLAAGPPEVLVGQLPDALSGILRPVPGWRVVGSMVYPIMSVSALVAPAGGAAVARAWGDRLREAGWRSPQDEYREPRVGFLAPAVDDPFDPKHLCAPDNSSMVAISAAPRGADSVAVTVVRLTGFMASSCAGGAGLMGRQRREAGLPRLAPPEGVTMGRSGTSSGDEASAYARARTELAPRTLLEHYAAQMAAEGWVPGASLVGDDVAVQMFSRDDAGDARPVRAVLAATRLSSGEVDLNLRIMQPER
jgi:hypothetical protein